MTDARKLTEDEITIAGLRFDLSKANAAKNSVYQERDRLVALLSKIFPAHLCRHPDEDKTWEDDWRWIVSIKFPTGQASWHIHDQELELFYHLEVKPNDWDGHTTEEKYKRIDWIKKVEVLATEYVVGHKAPDRQVESLSDSDLAAMGLRRAIRNPDAPDCLKPMEWYAPAGFKRPEPLPLPPGYPKEGREGVPKDR